MTFVYDIFFKYFCKHINEPGMNGNASFGIFYHSYGKSGFF